MGDWVLWCYGLLGRVWLRGKGGFVEMTTIWFGRADLVPIGSRRYSTVLLGSDAGIRTSWLSSAIGDDSS